MTPSTPSPRPPRSPGREFVSSLHQPTDLCLPWSLCQLLGSRKPIGRARSTASKLPETSILTVKTSKKFQLRQRASHGILLCWDLSHLKHLLFSETTMSNELPCRSYCCLLLRQLLKPNTTARFEPLPGPRRITWKGWSNCVIANCPSASVHPSIHPSIHTYMLLFLLAYDGAVVEARNISNTVKTEFQKQKAF